MGIQANAYALIHPSYEEPELLIQLSQASGFPETLAEGKLRIRLGEDDLLVYMKQINIRTKMASGTMGANELPGVDISTKMLQVPTYMFKVRSVYDHHDVRSAGNWGFSAVDGYRLGMRQGNFQLARDACLFGMNPQNGEGIVNAPGATSINLPPDQYGNDSVLTYDNGDMAFFMGQQVQIIKTRTLQLGKGRNFTFLGPQRTLGPFEYNIVQLTQFQRPGAGSESTRGVVEAILTKNGDRLVWAYDDTLEGAGPGGTDIVIMIMTEVEPLKGDNTIDTNAFANGIAPNNPVCSTQYADMAAPREIMSPMAGGKTDFMMEWRVTPGWVPRPPALTLVYMPYQ